jgi:hypothetical protein
MSSRERVPDHVWIPDDELEALNLERIAKPDQTDEELARAILMTAAPMAAKSIAHLSVHATAEQVRLAASKYIIDGVVGGGFKSTSEEGDILMGLLHRIAANDGAHNGMLDELPEKLS